MVQTALEQSRRLAAEKMVQDVVRTDVRENLDEDEDEDLSDLSDDGNDEDARSDLDPEAFRIVEDALRRADEREDEDEPKE